MDDLIDELMDLYESYSEAKAELKDCVMSCYEGNDDADYVCKAHRQDCEEYKDQIKATIKKIVEANNV